MSRHASTADLGSRMIAPLSRCAAWCRLGFGLFALALATPALALSSDRPLTEFGVDVYNTREGLPHNQVNAIAQTPEGYLWFGTWEGLVRYDGTQFRVYDRSNVANLRDNGVRSLRVTRDGGLLVGTSRGGVATLRDGRWIYLEPREGLPSLEIMRAEDDALGTVWIATEAAGVAAIDRAGKVVRYTTEQGLPSNTTIDLAIDRENSVWVATSRGLAVIQRDKLRSFGADSGLPGGPISSVLIGRKGEVFVGTEHGAFRFDGARFIGLAGVDSASTDTITALFEDRVGALWAGTGARGLLRYGEHGEEHFGVEFGLPNSRIASIYEDREGSVWVGTNGGLMRLKEGPFSMLDHRHGLADDFVRAVLQDKQGVWWFGTSRGLSSFRDGRLSTLTTAQGLASDSVLSLFEDRDGAMWVGTFGRGATRLSGGESLTIAVADGLPGNQVRAFAQTPDGSLWIGTTRGLARRTASGIQAFTERDGLPRDYILSLHVDAAGTLWIGTASGLARFRREQIEPMPIPREFQMEDIFGFSEDAQGVLWMATDRGLLRYHEGRFARFGVADGLPVETLFQVVGDGYGYLWLTSNRGVLRVSRSAAMAVLDGQKPRAVVDVFREADGLGSAQCNGGSGPAAWMGSDDTLRIATAAGVASVKLDRFNRSPGLPPPVVIETFRVDDRDQPLGAALQLPAGSRRMEFRFSGLTFLNPDRVRFRYRLLGFEQNWTQLQGERSAHYTNIPPGDFVFEVEAANADGPWSAEPTRMGFTLLPHWYQRLSVRALFGVLLLLTILGLYRARVAALHSRQEQLARLVEERTRDLEQRNQQLLSLDRERNALLEQVGEQKAAFERQAREDALTGLPNRRQFDADFLQLFQRCRERGEPITAGLIDVDHFKRVNDTYSHAAGDAVLRIIGAILREQVIAPSIAAVARYGGEEFALAFPGLDAQQAAQRCELLRQAFASHDYSGIHPELRVTASFGLSDRADVLNHERLLALADEKLYEAKKAGRDRVVF